MAHAPRQRRRPQDFRPGKISAAPPDPALLATAAEQARYRPDGKHKSYPAPDGEWSFVPSSGGSRCVHIDPADWPAVEQALRQAIRDGIVDEQFRGGFPTRCWVYVNGTLNEARLTNETQGEYHGFPLDYVEHHPSDPGDSLARAPRIQVRVVT